MRGATPTASPQPRAHVLEDLKTILPLVRDASIAVVMMVILFGGFKEWWVWGWQYRREVKRGDKWEEAYLKLRDSLDEAVSALREAIEVIRRKGGG